MRSAPLDRPCVVCRRPDEEKPICYRGTVVCSGRCAEALDRFNLALRQRISNGTAQYRPMTTSEHDFTD